MTEFEELYNQLIRKKPKGREWLTLEKRVHEFIRNRATEEEKRKLCQYTEMLYMACRAVEKVYPEEK